LKLKSSITGRRSGPGGIEREGKREVKGKLAMRS
jgi:hypothetical protein